MDMPTEAHTPPTGHGTDPLWFKDAVIYQLHVKSFFDANNDGIGDIAGLIDKLDYIASLGVNTLWLLPFYPSPRRDDGYDIAEYCAVHPDYGTLDDARRLIDEAHRRGLRVITELVINHTSDQHAWFQRARHAPPGSPERDFYVWSDTDSKFAGTRIIFIDTEKSNWTWDPVAGAYFWHRFYSHQPDLNFDNPAVMTAVLDVMRFWLDMGVDGLRLDAVPYLVEREGTNNENLPETHAVLKQIRATLDAEYPDRMLLAEANQWPEDTQVYFGDGDECHMAFHFPLMPRMYMAIAQEDRFPVTDIMRQTPAIPDNCQWAIFLRNHDELTLEMVSHKERDYLWETYAPDRRARLNLGIRRRLAPLVQRDRRRIELLNSLLLSMPGTPVIYYGDEIAMGDDIHLGDRDGVRTPMQWSPDRNGGFSRAEEPDLVLPAIRDPVFGYAGVNVERQERDAHSLLHWMRRLLEVRGMHRAFGRGTLQFLYPSNRRVLVYLREYTDVDGSTESILCVVNVSRSAQPVELDLATHIGQIPIELLSGTAFPPIGRLPYLLTLQPYGFYWFLLANEARMPGWYTPPPAPMPDLRTLVLRGALRSLADAPLRDTLENELLLPYLSRRRWYSPPDDEPRPLTAILASTPFDHAGRSMLLLEISGGSAEQEAHALLPLGFLPEQDAVGALPHQLAVSRLRRAAEVGYLTDATVIEDFARGVLQHLCEGSRLPSSDGHLEFRPMPLLGECGLTPDADIDVRRLTPPFRDAVAVGERAIIRVMRAVLPGRHPEVALAQHLSAQGFKAQLPLLGEVVRVDARGRSHTLIAVHAYRFHEGDAAERTIAALELALHAAGPDVANSPGLPTDTDAFEECIDLARRIGALAGDLHGALSRPGEDPDFMPGEYDATDADATVAAVRGKLDIALLHLMRSKPNLSGQALADTQALLDGWSRVLELPARYARALQGTPRLRVHGHLDPHLMLLSQGELSLIPAESVLPLPPEQRPRHSSPLADLASLLYGTELIADAFAETGAALEAPATHAQRGALAERYRNIATQALRDAWQLTAPPACAALLDERRGLLDLFMLDTAATLLIRPGPPPRAVTARLLQMAGFHPEDR